MKGDGRMKPLDERLESLREGRRVRPVAPERIPCLETSDPARLCSRPLVSVVMVTYNHEPHVRQAIESVLAQRTDFAFELVIGEDCSQDRTREICRDFQRRFPEIVRVLWWHENVSKQGGNFPRCLARSRGEFVAVCEGDDYWTDPLKLQKQVELLRATGSVLCVADFRNLLPDGRLEEDAYASDGNISLRDLSRHYFHTSTYLVRRDDFLQARRRYADIVKWYDVMTLYCLLDCGKVCHLREPVSVYRQTGKGLATGLSRIERDFLPCLQLYDLYLHGPVRFRRHVFKRCVKALALPLRRVCDGEPADDLILHADELARAYWLVLRHDRLLSFMGLFRHLAFFLRLRKWRGRGLDVREAAG